MPIVAAQVKTAFDELETRQRGPSLVPRSKTFDAVIPTVIRSTAMDFGHNPDRLRSLCSGGPLGGTTASHPGIPQRTDRR